ncbi:hypothetical protein LTS15_009758 [Exophiala xenobiotica]|nr:hypothetical protein LTS15_009758 [Exophiala xenobiotica]
MSRPSLLHRPSSVAAVNKTIILVTGGNSGIGYEIVKKLALENSNFQVLLGCRDTQSGEEAAVSMGAPRNVNPIQLDITDDQSIEHCYLAIQQHFGRLDVLINNAGTAGRQHPADATLREKYNLTFNTNVISTGVFTDKVIPLLEKSERPKIIFLTSSLGSIQKTLEGGKPIPMPWYNSSNSAVNALMMYYAKLYPNMKVNAVCPGERATELTGTDMSEEIHPEHGVVRVGELVAEGAAGATGTYSDSNGTIPW